MPRTVSTSIIIKPSSKSSLNSGLSIRERDRSSAREKEQPVIAGAVKSSFSSMNNLNKYTNNHSLLPTPSEAGDGCCDLNSEQKRNQFNTKNMTIKEFLDRVDETYAEQFTNVFEREQINMEILAEMNHEQLKEIGITAYGVRHKILKGIEKYYKQVKDPFYNAPSTGSLIIELSQEDNEYDMVKNEVNLVVLSVFY